MPTCNTLVIVQPKLPAYRWSYFERIAREWPGRVVLIYGDDQAGGPQGSLANDRRPGTFERITVPWSRVFSRWVLATRPLVRAVLQARPDLLVLPGDLNQPGVHALLLLARFRLGIPAVCLGQYRRAGAQPLVTAIKPLWHRVFDGLVLYNQNEHEVYRQRYHYPAGRITYLNNGLDRIPPEPGEEQLARRHADGPFLCLGRLERKNRFDLALAAHARYRAAGGRRRLRLIGAGAEEEALRAQAGRIPDSGVDLLGAIYQEEALAAQLGTACAVVHPYAVGLSLNTAFGHGCPVLCCDDAERHMPEFWLWRDGVNGWGFAHHADEDEVAVRLARRMLHVDQLPAATYADSCRHAYRSVVGMTTDNMAGRTLDLLRRLAPVPAGEALPA